MEIKQKELKTKINFGGSTDSNTEENKIILRDFLDAPHSHQPNIIIQALGVDLESGLSSSEATDRLKLYGKNELNQTLGLSWWKILLGQFSSIIVWLLGVAAIISWLTDGWLEAVAILVVLALNGLIGFAIEWRAGRALDVLRRETKTTAKVRRDGYERKIEAWELVVGDIISLTAGDKVPADARLIEAVNLRVDESSFTGESLPVEKSIESVDYNSILAERCSMLYLGTMIVGGRAIAIVTATGSYTELGRIGLLIDKIETGQTILEQRLDNLGKLLVYIVVGIALVVLLSGILRGDNPLLMFEVAVSLAVAAVPEGLPAMTTLILAMGVLRMARRHAIVRRLSAVETLGSTTVICTDKTGTLTENKMTVQEYRLSNQQIITLSANKANGISDLEATLIKEPNFLRLARVNLLCNEAAFNLSNSKELTLGDPTETALIIGIQKLGFDVCNEKSNYQILKEIPFDSVTGRMMTVVQNNKSNKCFATMKGAPAVVLEACSYFIGENDKILALDEDTRKKFLKINEEMATRALRVLAFADQELEHQKAEEIEKDKNGIIEKNYTFLGFAGMSDPPREGVAEAIQEAQTAGIRVIMLTGDQVMTARAVANQLQLNKNKEIIALHSSDISDVRGENLANIVRQTDVFARVSPEDKLRIVEALQQTGEIVAVTGDGVNDAPALERSDIGIAMGERGTEVAKEAADVVLTDDNFSTIVKAIESGRTIYTNIIKFVHFLFTSNLAEVLVIFVAIMLGLPLPLLPLQILWINLVTDVFPAFALSVEPSTPETMQQPPRSPTEALISGHFLILIGWQGTILATIALGAYLWALSQYGEGAHSHTIALLAVVGVQLGQLFNCRSRSSSAFRRIFHNPFVFLAATSVILLQILAVNFPPLMRILDTVEPNMNDWLITLLSVILPILIVEIAKFLVGRNKSTN